MLVDAGDFDQDPWPDSKPVRSAHPPVQPDLEAVPIRVKARKLSVSFPQSGQDHGPGFSVVPISDSSGGNREQPCSVLDADEVFSA